MNLFLPILSQRTPEMKGMNEYINPPAEPIRPTINKEAPIMSA